MRRLLGASLLVLLAACGARAPAPVPSAEVFRDRQTPIWSNAGFDVATLSGRWTQVATFGDGCAPGALTFAPGRVDGALCLDGQTKRIGGPFGVTGPSRLLPAGEAEPWWILWIDYDHRSMAIGTPSGRFGFVLDRTGDIPSDRMKAAREIFEWNGYDTARLRSL